MAEEILATLTALFATSLLAIATLAGAFLWRRLQEVRDRIGVLEARLERLKPYEDALEQAAFQAAARPRGRARGRRFLAPSHL